MKNWILYFILFYSFNGLVCAQQTSYLNHGFSYHAPYDNIRSQTNQIYPIDNFRDDTCFVLGAYIFSASNYYVFFDKFDLKNRVFVNDSSSLLIDSIGYLVKLPARKVNVKIGENNYYYVSIDNKTTFERKTLIFKKNLSIDNNFEWVGSVLNSNYVTNYILMKNSQNNLISVGQDYEFDGANPNFYGRIFVTEMDTLGNIHSTKFSPSNLAPNATIEDAISTNNGVIVTGYRFTHKYLPAPIDNWVWPGYAILYRNNGTQKILRVGREDVWMDLPLGAIVQKNESELLIRTWRSEPSFRQYAIKDAIMCIDTALNIKWIQNLDSTEQYDKGLGDLIKTQDGNYVINGNDLNHELNEQVAETYQHLFRKHYLQKIDSTGKFIWKRNIIYNELFTIQRLGEITELANGDLLMPGMLFDQLGIVETPLQKMWIVRTDKYGCLVPGCEMYDDIDEKEANQIRLSLYPNPVVNELYVFNPTHAHSYKGELINLNGQVVKSNIFLSPQSTTIVPLSGLKSGIYILKCSDEKGNVQTHKVIKN